MNNHCLKVTCSQSFQDSEESERKLEAVSFGSSFTRNTIFKDGNLVP